MHVQGNRPETVNLSAGISHAILLDSVPDLIAFVSADMRYEYVNAAWQRWTGKDATSVIGKRVDEVHGKDSFERMKAHTDRVLAGKQSRFEYSVTQREGLRYIEVSYTAAFTDAGKVRGYTIHTNDITGKKESERKFTDFIENATVGMHWVDAHGTIVWANDAELNMLGYSREEYIGHNISEFHCDREVIRDILRRLSRNESLHEYEALLKCKDGRVLNVSTNSNVFFENGKFIHTRCFTVDITKRKRAEEALKESERRYRELVHSLPLAIYTCDARGRITYYNDIAVKLWGYGPALNTELKKFCAFTKVYFNGEFVPPDKTPMATALETGQSFRNLEPVFERPDGSQFNACVNIEPLYDGDGKVCGAINVFQDISQLKETEAKLRESEARYRELVHLLPAAIYTCDAEGRITSFNKAAVALWGREPALGKDLWCGSWKIFNPEDGSPVPLDTCPMAIAVKEGRAVKGSEIIVEQPNGQRRNVMPHPQPIFDSSGAVAGAVNMLVDVTEQKAASQALRESEQRFRMITDLVPIIIWTTDETGKVTYLNSQWSELTGSEARDGYGEGWLSWVHPDDKDRAFQQWHHALRSKQPFRTKFRYRNASGNYTFHAVTGEPQYNEARQFLGYLGILQDVTIQEQTLDTLEKTIREKTFAITRKSEDLKRSEERYHRMIDEVQDYAIILLSPDGTVENWNQGAEKIKGYTANEIVGKSFKVFYTEEDRKSGLPEKLIDKARREGRASQEGWRVRKDGRTFWGSIVITALYDRSNEVIGFSKVTRDLTARKAAEDKLKNYSLTLQAKNEELENVNRELAKMNHELTSFAYISSHDLQEPLRKIQTFASRIVELEEGNFGEKTKDYFRRIENAAHRMRSLIEDILSYSRAGTSQRKFVLTDLNQLLREVLSDLSEVIEERNATIAYGPLPSLTVIPFQFQQLIVNLLTNALKFTRPGVPPKITISAGMIKGDDIRNAVAPAEKNYHHISVSDNGIGFDPAYRSEIFELFQRLHNRNDYEGTGVGLAICKKIVENHGGLITAEGEMNKGATFNIYLPA